MSTGVACVPQNSNVTLVRLNSFKLQPIEVDASITIRSRQITLTVVYWNMKIHLLMLSSVHVVHVILI